MVSEEASWFGSSLFTIEFIHVSVFTHCFSKTGGGLVCSSRYFSITHISLRACMHYMYVHGILKGTRARRYNNRDGEGAPAPENFGIILSENMIGSIFFYVGRTNKSCYLHAMCKMRSF